MKKIKILIWAAAAAFLAACSAESVQPESVPGELTLKVRCAEPVTRVDSAGVNLYNENLIQSLDYFFFDTQGVCRFNSRSEGLNAIGEHTLHVMLSDTQKNDIFGTGTTASVYVIANLPASVSLPATITLEALEALALPAAFEATKGNATAHYAPESFIMRTDSPVTVTRAGARVTAETVQLARVASKVSIDIAVAPQVVLQKTGTDGEITQEIWEPMLSGMNVYLCNAVDGATLGAAPVQYDAYPTSGSPYFNYDISRTGRKTINHYEGTHSTVDSEGQATTENVTYYRYDPFYTYPQKWTYGKPTEPYLKLVLPWKNGKDQKNYYYRVMLPTDELAHNNWYKAKLYVGILGSDTDDGSITITGSYSVQFAHWTTDGDAVINTSFTKVKYLIVSESNTHRTIYNENSTTLQFSSSDECVITDIHVDHPYYGTGTAPTQAELLNSISLTLDATKKNSVTFTHVLNNELGADMDMTPYTVTFTLKHKDDATGVYKQEITITQNPAMFVVEDMNSDGRNDGDLGYVYVNKTHYDSDNWDLAGGLTGRNTNENMYVVSVSVLPPAEEGEAQKIIGDPRISGVDNIPGGNPAWKPAPSVDGGERTLQNYKRTERSNRTVNMVAPMLRVASSYGAALEYDFDDASRRCASYQEDGIVAGRWRLPTKGEVEFLITLSAKKLIPRLFGSASGSSTYWTANGTITVNGNNVSNYTPSPETELTGSHYVRCVYDEWYWGSTTNASPERDKYRSVFTWGD